MIVPILKILYRFGNKNYVDILEVKMDQIKYYKDDAKEERLIVSPKTNFKNNSLFEYTNIFYEGYCIPNNRIITNEIIVPCKK